MIKCLFFTVEWYFFNEKGKKKELFLQIVLKLKNVWTKIDQVIRLRNYINFYETSYINVYI